MEITCEFDGFETVPASAAWHLDDISQAPPRHWVAPTWSYIGTTFLKRSVCIPYIRNVENGTYLSCFCFFSSPFHFFCSSTLRWHVCNYKSTSCYVKEFSFLFFPRGCLFNFRFQTFKKVDRKRDVRITLCTTTWTNRNRKLYNRECWHSQVASSLLYLDMWKQIRSKQNRTGGKKTDNISKLDVMCFTKLERLYVFENFENTTGWTHNL